jgi:hypothetical protein
LAARKTVAIAKSKSKPAASKSPSKTKPAAAKKAAKVVVHKVTLKKSAAKQSAAKKPAAKAPASKAPVKKSAAKAAAKAPLQSAASQLEGVFVETGWTFKKTVHEDPNAGASGEVIQWDIDVPPEEHFDVGVQLFGGEQVVIFLVFREKWPQERSVQVYEVLARVNQGLLMGSYETSLGGAVRLKASLDFRGCSLEARLVVNLIVGLMDVSEIYDDAVLSVMRGKATAEAAVAEVESEHDHDHDHDDADHQH